MSTTNIAYGSSTAITITASTLASSSTVGRESAAVDNSTNKYLDALVTVSATANGTPTANTVLYVYAAGSEDGTTFTGNATGSDASITLASPNPFSLVGTLPLPATLNSSTRKVFSIALGFGGILPRKWSIVVLNSTGVALSALSASYTGITATSA